MTDTKQKRVIYTGKDLRIEEILAAHNYVVAYQNPQSESDFFFHHINFQTGPVLTSGVNGVQNEHLITIIIDRLGQLNDQFPCEENLNALSYLKQALASLDARTKDRQHRGVEGEHKL